MTREQAVSLVNQVQNSHRLLAGFYGRLLPALDAMAARFNATFWYWDPIDFSRPCRSSTKPSGNWAWDYLPLLNTQFVYVRTDEKEQVAIEFKLHTDPSVLRPNRKGKAQPDPLSLPAATPVIRIYVYWLTDKSVADIKLAWQATKYPEGDMLSVSDIGYGLEGTWWEVDLADFVVDSQATEELIGRFISLPAPDCTD